METERRFLRSLRVLGGSRTPRAAPGGRWVLVPPSADYPLSRSGGRRGPTAAERRRRNLTVLSLYCIATFVLGLVPPLRFLLVANLVGDVLLIAYFVAALIYAARPVPVVRPSSRPAEGSVRPPKAAGGMI